MRWWRGSTESAGKPRLGALVFWQGGFRRFLGVLVPASCTFLVAGCASYRDSYSVHHIQKAHLKFIDPPSTVVVPPAIDGIGQFVSLRLRYSDTREMRFTTPTNTPYHQDGTVGYPGNYRVEKSPSGFGAEYRLEAETPEYFAGDLFASFDVDPPPGLSGPWLTAETFGAGFSVHAPWISARIAAAFGFATAHLVIRDSVETFDLNGNPRNVNGSSRNWDIWVPREPGVETFGTLSITIWPSAAFLAGIPSGLVPFAGYEGTILSVNGLAGPYDYDLKKAEWTAGVHYDSPRGVFVDVSGSWARLSHRGTEAPGYYRAEARLGSNIAPLIRALIPN